MRTLLAGVGVFLIGCGGGAGANVAPAGEERGPCFPNGTCAAGLSCFSDLCVKDTGAGGASSGTGGATATGGSGGGGSGGGGSTASSGSGGSSSACASTLEVAAGTDHTCALRTDGSLWCWGSNSSGELGIGKTSSMRVSPLEVTALGTDVTHVAAGYGFTCASKTDGSLWCWGDNSKGQLGDGTTTSSASPVQVAALGTNVVEVMTGSSHACARKTDGTFWCWGDNSFAQLGDGTMGFMTAGCHCKSTPVQVTVAGASIAELAPGAGHACARKTDGSLWCWGGPAQGSLGNGKTSGQVCGGGSVCEPNGLQVEALGTSVAQVASDGYVTCARKTDGTLWCWGDNVHGQVGVGTTTDQTSPAQVTELGASVAHISVGGGHSCARKADDTLWCWGSNVYGELGFAPSGAAESASPVEVTALGPTAGDVALGGAYTCAHKTDGTLWCWGSDDAGQLGDGTTKAKSASPVQPAIPCP